MSLQSLHMILRSVIFPKAMPKHQRFGLTKDDYLFLQRYMSMQPGESKFPSYDTSEYWNNYVKMILFGVEKNDPDPSIRIFSKSGWSYGFLTDAVYIADFKNNIEFMVSATIYCNEDGILNDDKYDYRKVTINEYIDLAKDYSTVQSGQFVNGILDNIHKELVQQGKMQKVDYKKT